MNDKQKTAVQWLIEQIKSDQNQKALSSSEWVQVIDKAIQMEREQIVWAYHNGVNNKSIALITKGNIVTADEYFTEGYQSNK